MLCAQESKTMLWYGDTLLYMYSGDTNIMQGLWKDLQSTIYVKSLLYKNIVVKRSRLNGKNMCTVSV